MLGLKGKYSLETPGKTGSKPGGDPVDIFQAPTRGAFYPQIAHGLCISHTWGMWTVSFGSAWRPLDSGQPSPPLVRRIERNGWSARIEPS